MALQLSYLISMCLIIGIDPEINQGGGWLRFLPYIVSITIAAKFKDMEWEV